MTQNGADFSLLANLLSIGAKIKSSSYSIILKIKLYTNFKFKMLIIAFFKKKKQLITADFKFTDHFKISAFPFQQTILPNPQLGLFFLLNLQATQFINTHFQKKKKQNAEI